MTRSNTRIVTLTLLAAALAVGLPRAAVADMAVASGRYVGAGGARAITGLGFAPSVVIVKGDNATAAAVRTSSMAGDAAKPLGVATKLKGQLIKSLDADGFTIGNDASVNAAGVGYSWIAFRGDPSRLMVGSYAGDGNAGHRVTTGFAPGYVLVMGDATQQAVQRFAGQTGDAVLTFAGSGPVTGAILATDATGFTLGNNATVNGGLTTYHFVAWTLNPGTMAAGTYTGDGTDGRAVTGAGFLPYGAIVAGAAAGRHAVQRFAPLVGDRTLGIAPDTTFADGIQGLASDGFQVGARGEVNAAGEAYYWAAFQNPAAYDLRVTDAVSPAGVDEGGPIAFTPAVTNFGPTAALNVIVHAPVPAGMTLGNAAPSLGSYDAGAGNWLVGTLQPGATATLALTGTVNLGTTGQAIAQTAVLTSSNLADLQSRNDADSASAFVQYGDLDVRETLDDLTPVEGTTVAFTVRVSNHGPSDMPNASIADALPSGLAFAAASPSRGSYDPTAGVWTIGTIAAGDSAALTLSAQVSPGTAGGSIVNRAWIAHVDRREVVAANDTASATVTPLPPIFRVVSGAYVGDGTASRAIPTVGFEPDLLLIKGNGVVATQARTRTMSGDAAKDLGSGNAVATGRVLGLTSTGFVVGADATVNASGTSYRWTAFLDVPGVMKVGSYVGNGIDNRGITGVGFQPCYVVVLSEGGKGAFQRFSAEIGDASTGFASGGEVSDRIQRLDPDGFQIGQSSDVNGAGVTYHYVAWSATAGLIGGGTYGGDGSDDRNLDVTGFRPDELLITRNGTMTVRHSGATSGDLTYPVPGGATFANGVQAARPQGFQVGSDATVNAATKTYFYTAFRDGMGADLAVTVHVDVPAPVEGQTIHLGVQLDNDGPQAATGVVVADALPAGLTPVAAPNASQGAYDANAGAWTVGALAAGATATLDFTVTVDHGTAGATLMHRASVQASSTVDPIGTNDADSVAIAVQLADVEIDVAAVDATPTDHEPVTWTVQAVNHGPRAATGVRVLDLVPAPAVYATSSATAGAYDPTSGVWTLSRLESGASATLTLGGAIPFGAVGAALVDSARIVAADVPDTNLVNNAAAATAVVQKNEFRVVSGQYVGDGTAAHAVTGIGFQPDLVILKGANASPAVARTRTMTGDAAKELGTSNALAAAHVRSLDPDGFTVGSDASVNQSGTTYSWTAFLEAPGEMKVGSYTGDGIDGRSFAGLGFAPGYVVIMNAGTRSAVQRFASEVGDATLPVGTSGEATDKIQSFANDGFQLGQSADVNAASAVYHYVAWSAASSRVRGGLYLGDGTTGRTVSDVGFRPGLLLMKRQDNAMGVQRPAGVDGDVTLPVGAAAPFAGGIQALLPTGFQVGGDARVNGNGKVYFWTAFRDVPGLDLAVTDAVTDSTPNEGESIHWTIRVYNLGPETATGVQVVHARPAGTTFQTYVLSRGVFDAAHGAWSVGALAPGDSASLDVQATVDAGTQGTVLHDAGYVATLDQTDSNNLNDQASAAMRVRSADVEVRTAVDKQAPTEGDTLHVSITVRNHGPDPATGLGLLVARPAGLTPMAASASQGSYLPTPGTWTVGTLAPDSVATLALTVFVAAGTGGDTLAVAATVTAATVADPVAANQSDSTSIFVALAPGIQITARQTAVTAAPGATGVELLALRVLNSGAETRTLERAVLTNRTTGGGTPSQLDAELGTVRLYRDDGDGHFGAADSLLAVIPMTAGQAVFDSLRLDVASGSLAWLFAVVDLPLGARDGDVLDLAVEAPGDLVFDRLVSYLNGWPVDPGGGVTVDGMVRAQVGLHPTPDKSAVPGTLRVPVLDVTVPSNGYAPDVLNEIHLVNLGSALAGTDVRRVEVWGDGGDQVFDAGNGDDFRIGAAQWDGTGYALTGLIVPVPVGGMRLFASVDLADSARIGRTVQLSLPAGVTPGVVVASGDDGPRDAAVIAAGTLTVRAMATPLSVTATSMAYHGLLPGAAGQEILRLAVANQGAAAETLTTVTVRDQSHAPAAGDPAQLDADWMPLQLVAGATTLGSGVMTGGRVTFSGFGAVIAAYDSLTLSVRSGAALLAHDSDGLGLALVPDTDFVFTRPVNVANGSGLLAGGRLPVQGMALAQMAFHATPTAALLTGSTRNVALDVTVPGNGFSADTLQLVLVRNLGDAQPNTDLARLEAWADDGDGVFRPAAAGAAGDTLLGVMGYVGGAWAVTGFQLYVPPAGRRLFVTCDIAADAVEGRSVRLALPSSPFQGIGMVSGNNGPRDQDGRSPVSQTITTVDRVVFSTQDVPARTAAPGDTAVVLLHLVGRNTYADSTRTLTQLSVTDNTSGAGAAADLDAEIHRLRLRADVPNGPVVGTGFFTAGRATLTGLGFAIPPSAARHLYLTADLSTGAATDGDVLGAAVVDENDIGFASATAVAAKFPMVAAAVTVDGMTAAQLVDLGAAGVTLGPSEGPALALDFVVPRNGYQDDVLEGVRLVNAGSAAPADLGEVRLWRDGGNSAFDAGGGDDVDLGPMTYLGGRWVSPALSEAVPVSGVRLFVSVTASATPSDSAVVRLQVPENGLALRTGNDGPIDQPFTARTTVLLSTAHLLASFDPTVASCVVGDSVHVRLTVRNAGPLAITGITPATLAASGDGALTPAVQATPPTLDLASGTQGTFQWTLIATAPGAATLTTAVTGTELGTGALQRSLSVATPPEGIFVTAHTLSLFGVGSAPSTARRGQKQVVPLTLTFTHPGGASVSDILLRGLHIELEDENGAGIAPSSLLAGVGLNEGANVYFTSTAFADTGRRIDLPLSRPIRIENGGGAGGQVTLTLSIDVSDTTNVPSFRLLVPDASALDAVDAVSGAPVAVALDASQSYPISSGLARIVSGATEVDVTTPAAAPRAVTRGQQHVGLLDLTMANPGTSALGPDIRVGSFGVSLVDSTGAPIAVPGTRLKRLHVALPGLTLLDRAVTAADGAILHLSLSPQLTLPMNVPLDVTLSGDLADSASLGPVRLVLADSSQFVARNGVDGSRMPALYDTTRTRGPLVTIQQRADSLHASGASGFPAAITVGATDVPALTVTLTHPGGPQSANIRCDALTLTCRDQTGQPLVPSRFVNRARALVGGVEVGLVTNLPGSGGSFDVPLTGVVLAPGASARVEVRLNIEPTAPVGLFELTVLAGGVQASEVNLGSPVATGPDTGASFPLSSGITRLETPARQVEVGFTDRIPAVLVADGRPVPAATLALTNTHTSGQIHVDHLEIVAGGANLATRPIGGALTRVEAWVADTLWATTGDLAVGAATAVLAGASPLSLDPATPVVVEVRVAPRAGAASGFRVGCAADGVGVVQPDSPLLSVAIVAASGTAFPFWTRMSGFTAASLQDSYSNFPNPFAAGRQTSRFAFYLKTAARVTLALWTVRGDKVATLLDEAPLAAGLHQETEWDGRNGLGAVVVNGAYVAEIRVRYDDGTAERQLRKVAVVR